MSFNLLEKIRRPFRLVVLLGVGIAVVHDHGGRGHHDLLRHVAVGLVLAVAGEGAGPGTARAARLAYILVATDSGRNLRDFDVEEKVDRWRDGVRGGAGGVHGGGVPQVLDEE